MKKFNKNLYLSLLLASSIVFISCDKQPASPSEKAWAKVPEILSKIVPPSFPELEFNVIEFGAQPGTDFDSRIAIQTAIDSCNAEGGGKVVIPSGEYLLNGPLHLKSNVNLHLEEGATIFFGVNPEDYLPVVEVRWEGTRCLNYSPLIYANGQKNIAITGKGTIDGQQQKFWILWKLLQDKDKKRLRTMGKNLVPLEERIFGKGHFLRPSLIQPYKSENILIEGVTVKNSPFWTMNLVFCTNVTIRNVNIQPGQSNDDGCNPESSSYVLIEDCNFYTEDDNIAIKAGRDNDAWVENGGRSTENIIIRNNTFRHSNAGAISIGSEMSGGVRNIFAENNTVQKVGMPIYIKSNTDRGGFIENIYYRNFEVDSCREIIRIRLDYKGADAGKHPADFKNFFFENIKVDNAKLGIRSLGLPEKSIENIFLNNITINEIEKPSEIYFTENIKLQNFNFNSITANEKEYYDQSSGGEEDPDRLYWKDLPSAVQETFVGIFNTKIDEIQDVQKEYKDEIKNAFAEEPTVNSISIKTIDKEKAFRLLKLFGWENIDVTIKQDGQIIN